ncbi:hypothetical protein EDB83DRAFT_2319038 [Lactarius deliciosus]|nr:hypothetical protein EDB83DRAFT_2319038 [Lactarius deliciosus]
MSIISKTDLSHLTALRSPIRTISDSHTPTMLYSITYSPDVKKHIAAHSTRISHSALTQPPLQIGDRTDIMPGSATMQPPSSPTYDTFNAKEEPSDVIRRSAEAELMTEMNNLHIHSADCYGGMNPLRTLYSCKRYPKLLWKSIYDIVARVVEYQTGRNPISLSHDDNRFKLMGDISQLRRVPFKTQDISKQNIKLFKIPAWITVSGTVTSVDEDTLSFVVTTKQYVSTGDGNDTLRVRGRLEKGPRWKEPLKRLPTVNNIVHFEGALQEVEEHDGNIQPVVLLDFIIYQTKPKKEDPGADEDNDLMLQRAKKYSQDNEGDGQSSPKALGKRKAPESDDEDAQSVKKELENSDNDNNST